MYDEKTGKRHQRHGQDVLRGNVPVPCDNKLVGCPKGHYDDPITLSDRNKMAYSYYKEGKAVDWQGVEIDAVVRHYSAFIADIEANAEKVEQYKLFGGLSAVMSGVGGQGGKKR